MERAAGELGFDPRTAFVVGDQSSDLEFGRRAGATTFLVRTGYGVSADPETLARADYVVAGLGEAVPVMESLRRVAAGREGGAEGLIRSVRGQLLESAALKRLVADRCAQAIVTAADLLSTVFREGGKLLLCGNGGSAADCQHMAAEFVSRLRREVHRPGLPAVALTTDTSFLTAFSNDAEFDGIFERQVSTLGKVGDGLIAISTSGSSRNIVRAVQMAKRMGVRSIALTGAKGLAGEPPEVTIAVPSADTQRIQEAHLAIEHVLCDLVEQRLFASR
jgi:D-sedoheptulose 7-phosphate isomerase